jgi:hypothetical protein
LNKDEIRSIRTYLVLRTKPSTPECNVKSVVFIKLLSFF